MFKSRRSIAYYRWWSAYNDDDIIITPAARVFFPGFVENDFTKVSDLVQSHLSDDVFFISPLPPPVVTTTTTSTSFGFSTRGPCTFEFLKLCCRKTCGGAYAGRAECYGSSSVRDSEKKFSDSALLLQYSYYIVFVAKTKTNIYIYAK